MARSVLLLGVLVLFACDSKSASKPGAAAAGSSSGSAAVAEPAVPAKQAALAEYELRGIPFAYFKVPAGLAQPELITTAQALHAQVPTAQLVLVDDDSQLKQYVGYVKAISGQGEITDPMPQEWADKHIVANVQRYTSGKYWLCESNGSKEIAELK
jgi:hypothetical protein